MRRIILSAMAALIAAGTSAQGFGKLYADYRNTPGAMAVCLPPKTEIAAVAELDETMEMPEGIDSMKVITFKQSADSLIGCIKKRAKALGDEGLAPAIEANKDGMAISLYTKKEGGVTLALASGKEQGVMAIIYGQLPFDEIAFGKGGKPAKDKSAHGGR